MSVPPAAPERNPQVPPPPAPSQSPTPPPAPSPQNVAVQAVAVPQAGVTFTPMSDKSRRRIKRIVVGVVALVVLGVVATVALTIANWTRTPEAKVRQYLDLLADGKASAATAMVDPGLPNDQRGFLSDEVMASSSARIEVEDVTADDAERSKERVVTATMRLDGERFTRSFRVTEAKKTFGLLKNWKIQDAMVARVDVQADNVTHFSIGGEKMSVATLKEAPSSSIVLYPGVYTFTPEETGEYIDAAPKTISVKAATGYDSSYYGGTVELKGTYNDKMAAAALDAAAALTNSCATVPGNIDSACPSAVQSRTLALLQVKTMPTAMKATTDEGGVYTGEATFTIQGMESWDKQRDVTSRVTATVKTDKDGNLELDASGKPQFEVRFGY
ncbi:hypothetical protein [Actinomyces sp. HMSC035G02]|uniref:hypothetical protein n=1 Tax=Actinomyces sp. HMSC035G02 TaxID=1739406 RepID=UPI0025705DF3|nr:hypothetical protein [Actinomyces sp. HMSC035G02]